MGWGTVRADREPVPRRIGRPVDPLLTAARAGGRHLDPSGGDVGRLAVRTGGQDRLQVVVGVLGHGQVDDAPRWTAST